MLAQAWEVLHSLKISFACHGDDAASFYCDSNRIAPQSSLHRSVARVISTDVRPCTVWPGSLLLLIYCAKRLEHLRSAACALTGRSQSVASPRRSLARAITPAFPTPCVAGLPTELSLTGEAQISSAARDPPGRHVWRRRAHVVRRVPHAGAQAVAEAPRIPAWRSIVVRGQLTMAAGHAASGS